MPLIYLLKIKRYLRENRLEIIEPDNHFLFCEACKNQSVQAGTVVCAIQMPTIANTKQCTEKIIQRQ